MLKPTIGLEIHVQLNTASKLFCSCSTASFGADPNSNICPICLGHPGTLPVLNRQAVERLLQMAVAFGCQVRSPSIFARKNYFYPDLPKNYQISQFEEPLAENGKLEFYSGGEKRSVCIKRIHLEEDAGKLLHAIGATELDYSLVDFNRAGLPLAETVTEPDIATSGQASDFLVALRATLRRLGVSNCDMEKGEMRVDVNVSVAKEGGPLGTRVEIKNLNSFKAVRDALEYEMGRQSKAVAAGENIRQETRLWDVKRGQTQALRSKEDSSDYRYFPDPDLLPLVIEPQWLERLKDAAGMTPDRQLERYQQDFGLGLKEAQALVFHEDHRVSALFEETAALAPSQDGAAGWAKSAANWILNDLLGYLAAQGKDLASAGVTSKKLAAFINITAKQGLSSRLAKDLFAKLLSDPSLDPQAAASGFKVMGDETQLLAHVKAAIQENPKAVQEYLAGKEKAIGSLIGAVMKKTQGQAHPQKLQELFKKELKK